MSMIIDWFINFPPDVATALISMTPFGELRAGIPIGIEVFDLRPLHALIVALIGNAIPALLVIFGLEAITQWCHRNVSWGERILQKIFERTEKKFQGKYAKYGAVALFVFTAIPFPLTGVWTASIAAVLFRINYRYSLPAILLGMLVAGIIVTFATLGTKSFIFLFF
ncbi:MAG: small multi-drug export protein [Candidatus Uhrbacteria bacterium]